MMTRNKSTGDLKATEVKPDRHHTLQDGSIPFKNREPLSNNDYFI
jgi:hypothetical protein